MNRKTILTLTLSLFLLMGQTAIPSPFPKFIAELLEQNRTEQTLEHLKAFQKIADENEGNRSAGTSGHALSAHYVANELLSVGYRVELQPFEFVKYDQIGKALFTLKPSELILEDGKDFNVMAFSGSGQVEAPLTVVDVELGENNQSTSGCETSDFENFPAGTIALIQRGTCPFSTKAENAQAAGAIGVLIFNQGDQPSRRDLFGGTLGGDSKVTLPVYSIPTSLGEALIEQAGVQVGMQVETSVKDMRSYNVIAETRSGNPDNIVMIGAHLDGVHEGAGLNDNGSGSAAILQVAKDMAQIRLNNRIRFAWWSAEELGLVGSTRYVEGLSDEERNRIALYLNFDMIASPNYLLGVYDGDGSRFGAPGPRGSDAIEQVFHAFYGAQGRVGTDIEISNRSDYASFAQAGIPFGGLATGAEGTKTEEEAALYGGTAGQAYDSCYHQACDTIDNINREALEIHLQAITYAAVSLGLSTHHVNGEKRRAQEKGQSFLPSLKKKPVLHYHLDGVGEVSTH